MATPSTQSMSDCISAMAAPTRMPVAANKPVIVWKVSLLAEVWG